MKKELTQKLTLRRQTIAALNSGDMGQVFGGNGSLANFCRSRACTYPVLSCPDYSFCGQSLGCDDSKVYTHCVSDICTRQAKCNPD